MIQDVLILVLQNCYRFFHTLTANFPSSASYTLTNYNITHYDSYANLPSWSSGYSFVNEFGIATSNSFLTALVYISTKDLPDVDVNLKPAECSADALKPGDKEFIKTMPVEFFNMLPDLDKKFCRENGYHL